MQTPTHSPLDENEVVVLTFDYAPQLVGSDTISSAVMSMVVVGVDGVLADAAPASRLVGSPSVISSPSTGQANAAVSQKIGNNLAGGNTYQIQCLATTAAGYKLDIRTNLPIVRVPT